MNEKFIFYLKSIRRACALIVIAVAVFISLFSSKADAQGKDGLTAVVETDNLALDTGDWIESDWVRIIPRSTGNTAEVGADGVLRLFLGPFTGADRHSWHGHHANLARRPLRLYGDFSITCELQWNWMTRYSVRSGRLTLLGPDTEAVLDIRNVLRVWPGRTEALADVPNLPLEGEATVRFERRAGILKIFWDNILVAESEWPAPVKEISLTARTYRDRQRSGSFIGISRLSVFADSAGLALSQTPVAEDKSLLPGGDFQEHLDDDLGIDLGSIGKPDPSHGLIQLMEVEHDGPESLGTGELKGWATPVDGKRYLWFQRDPTTDSRAVLLDTAGSPGGLSFESKPFSLEPGADYILTGFVKLSRDVIGDITLSHTGTNHENPTVARWSDTTARRVGFTIYRSRRIAGNWFPISVPFNPEKDDELSLVLSVRPVWSGTPFGTAAFSDISIRKITVRDKLQQELEALVDAASKVDKEAEQAGYISEVAYDISGFDLDEAPDSEQKTKVAGKRKAFKEWSEQHAKTAALALLKSVLENGAVLTFFDYLDLSEIEARATALRAATAHWQNAQTEWLTRSEELRTLSAPLRPPRTPAPDYGDNLDWASNRFHIYWFNHYGLNPPGLEEAIRYMGAMGATILQIRPFNPQRRPPYNNWEVYKEEVRKQLDLCEREGMKVLIYGATGPIGGAGEKSREQTRESLKRYIDAFGGHPAFGGFEMDEISSGQWPDFPQYLRERFTENELKELGIISESIDELDLLDTPAVEEELALPELTMDDEEALRAKVDAFVETILAESEEETGETTGPLIEGPLTSLPSAEFREKSPLLFILGLEWRRDAFEESLDLGFNYARSLKKDVLMMPLLSPAAFLGGPFSASLGGVSALGDMISIDPYWNGVPEEAFFCDLMKSSARGPALLTVGTHYGGSPASLARDLAISYAHTDGVYIFDWPFCFKQKGPYADEYWAPGRWEKVLEFADKASRIEPHLVKAESPAKSAQIYSERSSAVNFYRRTGPGIGASLQAGRYAIAQMGLYNLFLQSHLPMDSIYMRLQTAESLARYKTLVLQDAMALTDEQESTLREWVRAGGHLIVTASTSIKDRWGRKREDYGLSDLFGASYVATIRSEGTWFGTDPKVSYAEGMHFDEVKPTTGRVTATWADGRPAVIENTFGLGRCTFISARDLGNSCERRRRGHDGPRWYLRAFKDFHPGVREFFSGIVIRSLEEKGETIPFTTENCPEHVEVVIRTQNTAKGARRILHLLNYSFEEPVQGIEIRLGYDTKAKPVVFYPDDNSKADAEYTTSEDGKGVIVIKVRDFNVHEIIVVEI